MNLRQLESKVKNLSIEEIQLLLSKKMIEYDYQSFFFNNQSLGFFYRARKHNHKLGKFEDGELKPFLHEKEFWNPPDSAITSLGRCNNLNQSIFYCSNYFDVAVIETRPKKGDFITIASFDYVKYPHIENLSPTFRIRPIGLKYLSKIKGFSGNKLNTYIAERSEKYMIMDKLLDDLFHLKVNKNEENKYKLSIAVTNIMLTDILLPDDKRIAMHGMLYTSIIKDFKGINIVLKPEIVKNYFYIKSIQTLEVIDVQKNHLTLKLIRNGILKSGMQLPHLGQQEVKWGPIFDGNTTTISTVEK